MMLSKEQSKLQARHVRTAGVLSLLHAQACKVRSEFVRAAGLCLLHAAWTAADPRLRRTRQARDSREVAVRPQCELRRCSDQREKPFGQTHKQDLIEIRTSRICLIFDRLSWPSHFMFAHI